MHLSFDRVSQVWRYTASHHQLLLRSTKTDTHKTQIDVLFKNVAWLHLPALLEGLEIREASPADAENVFKECGIADPGDRRVFLLAGSNYDGYVIAGTVVTDEGNEDYSAPSKLLSGF